jgi:hypothetical protein
VIDQGQVGLVELGSKVRFGDRQTNRIGNALTERPGRDLNARSLKVFGVSRRF